MHRHNDLDVPLSQRFGTYQAGGERKRLGYHVDLDPPDTYSPGYSASVSPLVPDCSRCDVYLASPVRRTGDGARYALNAEAGRERRPCRRHLSASWAGPLLSHAVRTATRDEPHGPSSNGGPPPRLRYHAVGERTAGARATLNDAPCQGFITPSASARVMGAPAFSRNAARSKSVPPSGSQVGSMV